MTAVYYVNGLLAAMNSGTTVATSNLSGPYYTTRTMPPATGQQRRHRRQARHNFVDAAQLSQVTYRAGTSTDTVWARASDGLQYGAWPQGVTVIDAPVASPTSNSVLASNGQTFAATSLFTASDADGDSLTQYDF